MKTYRLFSIRIGALLLTGATIACGPTRPSLQEIAVPPDRIQERGYSFVPLNEPGWLVLRRTPEEVAIGKRAPDPDENIVIRSFPITMPLINSEEEFVGFAKAALVMEGATRHKVVSQESRELKTKGQSCVRTDTLLEDNAAVKRTSRTDIMFIDAISLLCKHPNGSAAVVLAYSHRFYKENRDGDAAKKAQAVFDSLQFAPL